MGELQDWTRRSAFVGGRRRRSRCSWKGRVGKFSGLGLRRSRWRPFAWLRLARRRVNRFVSPKLPPISCSASESPSRRSSRAWIVCNKVRRESTHLCSSDNAWRPLQITSASEDSAEVVSQIPRGLLERPRDETLYHLGIEKFSSSQIQKMEWEVLERKILMLGDAVRKGKVEVQPPSPPSFAGLQKLPHIIRKFQPSPPLLHIGSSLKLIVVGAVVLPEVPAVNS
nr:Exocyst complex component EXO70H1 [Ipomoea batatas]